MPYTHTSAAQVDELLAEGRASFLASESIRGVLAALQLSDAHTAAIGVMSLPPWAPGLEPPPRTGPRHYPAAAAVSSSGETRPSAAPRTHAPLGLPLLLPPPSTTRQVREEGVHGAGDRERHHIRHHIPLVVVVERGCTPPARGATTTGASHQLSV